MSFDNLDFSVSVPLFHLNILKAAKFFISLSKREALNISRISVWTKKTSICRELVWTHTTETNWSKMDFDQVLDIFNIFIRGHKVHTISSIIIS